MRTNKQNLLIDCCIFLEREGIKGSDHKKAAEAFIQAIKDRKVNAYAFYEDMINCLSWFPESRKSQLSDELDGLISYINVKEYCQKNHEFLQNYQIQCDSLKLNNSLNTCLLASLIAYNQTSISYKENLPPNLDCLVTSDPQKNYINQNCDIEIKSVARILEEISDNSNLDERKDRLKKQLSIDRQNFLHSAEIVAAIRAHENAREDSLIKCRYSAVLAGGHAMSYVETKDLDEKRPYVAVRTRYVDDWLKSLPKVEQVLILGCGMDTRAFRLEFPSGTVIFEVDQKELLNLKNKRLNKIKAQSKFKRKVIPADLTDRNWTQSLLENDFDPSKSTAIILEGVQMYLTEKQLKSILETVAEITIDKSFLFIDVINQYALHNSLKDREWKSGFDSPEELFPNTKWNIKVTQPGEKDASYGRYLGELKPRNINVNVNRAFFCVAEKISKHCILRERVGV